ncbi:hypothetical protein T03_13749 [Trichinella britovi]|uniref:Uncharacterized protein n=1 Tax=Trichinella britovi TaxID=45882 RepID=A0A0V1CU32_TRIBR|nr:hypothetical protein T03_13749 [Trichinella britovi]KRZ85062.1 hypothetical protein T08_15168 [Trichinella sp. T8]
MNTFVSHCATSDMFTGPHRAICCSHIVRKSMIGNMFVGYFNNSSRVVLSKRMENEINFTYFELNKSGNYLIIQLGSSFCANLYIFEESIFILYKMKYLFFKCSSEMAATLQLQFSIVWGSLLLWKKVPNCISEDTKKFHTAANRLFPNENLKYHPNDPLGVNGEQYEALNERIDSA